MRSFGGSVQMEAGALCRSSPASWKNAELQRSDFVGSPGRTRTCDQSVTSAPSISARLGLSLHPPGSIALSLQRTPRGGCRALMRLYWSGSSASSLCTFLPTPCPSAGFAQDYRSEHYVSGAGFPEFTRCCNHSFLWKLQSGVNFSHAPTADRSTN